MTLFRKTLLIVVVTTLAFLGVAETLFSSVVLDGIVAAEAQRAADGLRFVRSVVKEQSARLEAVALQWGTWDEACDFFDSRAPDFVERNLGADAFESGGYDYFLAIAKNGEVRISLKNPAARLPEVPQALLDQAVSGGAFVPLKRERQSLTGLLSTPQGVLLVSSSSVISSKAQGPIRGYFVLARYLSHADLQPIEKLTALRLRLSAEPQPILRSAEDSVAGAKGDEPQTEWNEATGELTAAMPLRDVFGRASMVVSGLALRSPTAVMGEIRLAVFVLLGAALLSLGLLFLFLMERFVLSRLRQVSANARRIQEAQDHALRLEVSGRDEISQLAGVLNSMLDALHTAHGEVRESHERSEAANRAKTEFLTNMSHEVRTPINGILGAVEALRSAELNDEQREALELAQTASHTLVSVMNDLLEYARLESGGIVFDRRPFSLRKTISAVMRSFEQSAQDKSIVLVDSVDPSIPDILLGDRARILQVLVNLVGNGIKFTPNGGGVIVYAHTLRQSKTDISVRLSVCDSGIGIPEDTISRIFEPFSQGDGSLTRRFGGAGVGLKIAARIVSVMGGTIDVKSRPGIGSRFSFGVDFEIAQEVAGAVGSVAKMPVIRESRVARVLQGLSVLLVEDNLVNQTLTKKLLQKRGCRVTVAENGADAVDCVQREKFNVVLMDCQMPVMDGYSAATKIRALEAGTSRHLPIIALTAHAIDGERQKCLEAGMDDYIAKPIVTRELLHLVTRHCAPQRVSGSGSQCAVKVLAS